MLQNLPISKDVCTLGANVWFCSYIANDLKALLLKWPYCIENNNYGL